MRSLLIFSGVGSEEIAAALASAPDALLIGVENLAAIQGQTIKPRLYVSLGIRDEPSVLADASAAVAARPSGVALLSSQGGADVQRLGARLAVQEARAGLPEGVIRIIAFAAETPEAALDLSTYRHASTRLEALVASQAMRGVAPRAARAFHRGPVRLMRDLTLIAARACGAFALDGPFVDVEDLEGLRIEAAAARADGFDGKVALDPKQVNIINETFC